MQIALDAMGGDHAPEPIVAGAIHAAQADPELRIVLVGDQNRVAPLVSQANDVADRIEIFHCTQVIGMEETAVVALRKKPDNSISRCWELLAQRKVDAIVSAGNTGAMVAGGHRLRLFLKNVRRPGIAAVMPTMSGPCVLLDVGANVHPKPVHLFQYGVMGAIFAKHILRKENPRIGLMNVGSEEQKGHDLAKETHALFNSSHMKPQFIGNVEGRDITRGECDVFVTDGFVGNVVLKVCEGIFEFAIKVTARELQEKLNAEKDLAMKTMGQLIQRYDYHEQGGAPLLGIDGICIICHGSSGDRAIKNALGMASRYVKARLNSLIVEELEDMPALNGVENGGGS
jgi:glycerol-3-phosphate acyltransferase PlsX